MFVYSFTLLLLISSFIALCSNKINFIISASGFYTDFFVNWFMIYFIKYSMDSLKKNEIFNLFVGHRVISAKFYVIYFLLLNIKDRKNILKPLNTCLSVNFLYIYFFLKIYIDTVFHIKYFDSVIRYLKFYDHYIS